MKLVTFAFLVILSFSEGNAQYAEPFYEGSSSGTVRLQNSRYTWAYTLSDMSVRLVGDSLDIEAKVTYRKGNQTMYGYLIIVMPKNLSRRDTFYFPSVWKHNQNFTIRFDRESTVWHRRTNSPPTSSEAAQIQRNMQSTEVSYLYLSNSVAAKTWISVDSLMISDSVCVLNATFGGSLVSKVGAEAFLRAESARASESDRITLLKSNFRFNGNRIRVGQSQQARPSGRDRE